MTPDDDRFVAILKTDWHAFQKDLAEAQRREELMRPVVEKARALREQQRRDYLGSEATAAELWEHASDFRRVREAFEAAVDTYETQEGTE